MRTENKFVFGLRRIFEFCREKYLSVDIKLKKTINFALGICVIASLFNANFSLVYGVALNGIEVGCVAQRSDIDDAIDRINKKYAPYYSYLDAVDIPPVYSIKFVRRGDITTESDLCENIKKATGTMTKQTVIESDGNVLAGVLNNDEAMEALEICKNRFIDENTAECEIASHIEIKEKYAPSSLLSGAESAAEKLLSGEKFEPIKILTVEYRTVENEIAYEIERVEDSQRYEGNTEVITEGENGKETSVRKTERINGVLKSNAEISKTVEKVSKNQLLAIGTKPRPEGVGTGNFAVPYNGNITSRYGQRSSGNHKGVDIVGPVGSPIYASDDGVVIYADFEDGGFGNIVKIDHQNGYETYYAHCSEISVKKGDIVKKGDLIAKVGNTGRSTGPHLHFEIRKNGESKNPLDYIN